MRTDKEYYIQAAQRAQRISRRAFRKSNRSEWMMRSIRQVKLFFLVSTAFIIVTVIFGLIASKNQSPNQPARMITIHQNNDGHWVTDSGRSVDKWGPMPWQQ